MTDYKRVCLIPIWNP